MDYKISDERLTGIADAIRNKKGEDKNIYWEHTFTEDDAVKFDFMADSVYKVVFPEGVINPTFPFFNNKTADVILINPLKKLYDFARPSIVNGTNRNLSVYLDMVNNNDEYENNVLYFFASSILNSTITSETPVGVDESKLISPEEMETEINNLPTISASDLTYTDDLSYAFEGQEWMIKKFGDIITTKDVVSLSRTFEKCKTIEEIPFELNMAGSSQFFTYTFSGCEVIKTLPKINNAAPYQMGSTFDSCKRLREFPEGYFDDWDMRGVNTNTSSCSNVFYNCYSLRRIPSSFLKRFYNKATSAGSSHTNNMFYSCYVLEEAIGVGVPRGTISSGSSLFSNMFSNCYRLARFTFDTNEDGSPIVANFKGGTLDLNNVGYASSAGLVTNYNSGITADKRVVDEASYQALKNDADWFTYYSDYSRYNHDSAVETLASLPDTHAYGTNTIRFRGASGSATDGGAINTLTEAEIAVASAKGWTVTLV